MKKLILNLCFCLSLVSGVLAQSYRDDEWDDYFMPGIGYKTFLPKTSDSIGIYQGFTTEFVIYSRAKGKESTSWGPSRIKTYGNLSILSSSNQESRDIFFVQFGVNLSFEASIKRNWFIPYFGLESGGVFQKNYSTFSVTPVAGVQLVSTRKLIWNAQGGYLYTLKNFDLHSGIMLSSTVNLLLWNN